VVMTGVVIGEGIVLYRCVSMHTVHCFLSSNCMYVYQIKSVGGWIGKYILVQGKIC